MTKTKLSILIPCYNCQETIIALLESIEPNASLREISEIVIIDDQSTDKSFELVNRYAKTSKLKIKFKRNAKNIGRAQTLNSASEVASGEFLIFVDADCYFDETNALAEQLKGGLNHETLYFGQLKSCGDNFWGKYFNYAQHYKVLSAPLTFSSTNLLLARTSFLRMGGFSKKYKLYGFEDRDLIGVCLAADMKVAKLNDVKLIHTHNDNLTSYLKKMELSGRHSSTIYRSRFRQEYAESRYAKVDYREISTSLNLVFALLWCVSGPLRALFHLIPSRPKHLFLTKLWLARTCAAISYWKGTLLS